jgi:hypothetical protein
VAALRLPSLRDRGREMEKLTDDDIIAQALKCPESEKVPLEVGDRVIALEDFGKYDITKGMMGELLEDDHSCVPWLIEWEHERILWAETFRPIGKLVPRRK